MELKLIIFSALLCHTAVRVQSTANPEANENAKNLLAALIGLEGRVLSGAFGGYNHVTDRNGFSMDQANMIQDLTQKWPAVYGIDCSQGWGKTPENQETDLTDCFNQQAVDYGKRGGIITVSHHLPNPVFAGNDAGGGEGAFKTEVNNSAYNDILNPGTPQRNRWLKMMEKIAEGLQAYNAQGITVLYRPFHEMNGDWFWWGGMRDENQNGERQRLFKLLWQDLFEFMTTNKSLDNLLWVYSPDHSRGSRTAYYPGDDYVDIVGLDAYSDNPNDIQGYNEMISLGKPFAFSEVGPRSVNPKVPLDYNWFVETVLSSYPKTVYFMPWNDEWSPVKNSNAKEAYNNPNVINLGEL